MSSELSVDNLFILFKTVLIFLSRPSVQIQLLAFVVAMSLAWLLSKWLWSLLPKRFRDESELDLSNEKRIWAQYATRLSRYLLLPILGLMALILARTLILDQGGFTGFLLKMTSLVWAFLFYRLFIGCLYAVFPPASVRRYHYRLLAPVFALFFLSQILNEITPLNQLATIVLIKLFEDPITLGAVLIATVGLYLWIDAVLSIQDAIFHLLVKWTKLEAGVVQASLTLIQYGLIGVGLVFVLSNLGFDSTTFAAITGGLSIGIGFGLREIISNFISGIVLLYERSLKPGDYLNVEGEMCQIAKVNIRATTVRTFDNVEKVVPNQTFFTSSFTTYTGSDRIVRRIIPIGISYSSQLETVFELILNIAREHPKVLEDPQPIVRLNEFGESSINLELLIWLDTPAIGKGVACELNWKIWQAFAEHNIEIPFPQRDVHIRSRNN